jgi:1-aminocyclopropane-1-carboxylate deaminase/D-cysteine desulfhydrase-like pyridoxal-dependent ACC family enzyme
MFKLPTPIQEVVYSPFEFSLSSKRDDLIHPLISGNKYRKLKYNFQAFHTSSARGIISFGGVFSNHLHALAAACHHENIPCAAVIRGEDHQPHPTLDFLRSCGVALHFVSREAYRSKEHDPIISNIIQQYPDYMLIPEGGSSLFALEGVEELIDEIAQQHTFPDFLAIAAGTGATAAGILKGLKKWNAKSRLLVFSALKGDFLKEEIATLSGATTDDFYFTDISSLGGYARITPEYLRFLIDFERESGIEVDPVYNGKVLLGLHLLQEQGHLTKDNTVLWIHTGGLQGKAGFENEYAAIHDDYQQTNRRQSDRP